MSDYGFHFSRKWWTDLGFGMVLGALLLFGVLAVELAVGWVKVTGSFAALWGRGRADGDGRLLCRLPGNIRVRDLSTAQPCWSPLGTPAADPPGADRRCDIFPGDTANTLTGGTRWPGRTAPGQATGRHQHRRPPGPGRAQPAADRALTGLPCDHLREMQQC
jgi:hypothetical protein